MGDLKTLNNKENIGIKMQFFNNSTNINCKETKPGYQHTHKKNLNKIQSPEMKFLRSFNECSILGKIKDK